MSDKKKKYLPLKFDIVNSNYEFDYDSELDIYTVLFLTIRNMNFTFKVKFDRKEYYSSLPERIKIERKNDLKFGKLTDRDLLLLKRTERGIYLDYQQEHTSEDGLVDNEALAKIHNKFSSTFYESLPNSRILSLPEALDYENIFFSEFKDEWKKGVGSKGNRYYLKNFEWTTGDPLKLYYFILMNGYKAGHFIFDEDGSMMVTKFKKVQDGQLTLSEQNMHGSLELVSIDDQLRKSAELEGTSITGFLLFGIMIASVLFIVALFGAI